MANQAMKLFKTHHRLFESKSPKEKEEAKIEIAKILSDAPSSEIDLLLLQLQTGIVQTDLANIEK